MSKLSIITITRNNYRQLVETIDSLKSIRDYNLIVINGGECEQTKIFLIEQKIEHITERDDGIADAFNKGVSKSFENDSRYIIFINSGDRINNASYIEKAIDFLDKYDNYSFTYGDMIYQDVIAGNMYIPARTKFNLGLGMPCSHQTIIYRKYIFKQVGFFNCSYKYAMDYQHLCRMLKMGLVGKYIEAVPVVLMDGSGITSINKYLTFKESTIALIKTGLIYSNKKDFFIHCLIFMLQQALSFFEMQRPIDKT